MVAFGFQLKSQNTNIQRAAHARDQWDMIGGGVDTAKATLPNYQAATVTPRTVGMAKHIWGEPLAHAMGATTQKKPLQAVTEIRKKPHDKCVIEVDIAYFGKEPFLVGLALPDHYHMAEHIDSKEAQDVADALEKFIKTSRKNNVTVDRIRSDNEPALASDEVADMLTKYSTADNAIGQDVSIPGQHCAEIERAIRTMKEEYRGRQNTSTYGWPKLIVIAAVMAIATMLNMRCSLATIGTAYSAPPAVRFLGRPIHAVHDMKASFGQYALVTERTTSNSTEAPRVRQAIYVRPTLSTDHGHRAILLDTMQEVTRPGHAINIQPMPDNIRQLLDDAAEEEGIPAIGLDVDPRPQRDHRDQTSHRDARQPAAKGVQPANDDAEDFGDEDDGIEDVSWETGPWAARRADEPSTARSGVPAARPLDDDELPPPPRRGRRGGTESLQRLPSTAAALPRPGYNDRVADIMVTHNSLQDDLRAAELLDILKPMAHWRDATMVLKIAVKKAMKTREVEATASITKELKQMIDMRVWRPVRLRSLPFAERTNFIRSQCFLKDKWTAAGLYDKLKARLVARGDMQDKELYANLSSPTVATTSVLITAAICASEGRHAMSLDVPGAFLNADMAATGVKVRMLLDPIMTSILVKIDPAYADYINPNGTCLVELDKALYGTVEAAKLWYDMLTDVLKGEGFVPNPYDACVFNKIGKKGHQVTICLHVDDLLITCKDSSELDAVKDFLGKRFGDVTTHRGPALNYVGMTFDFAARPGKCEVTMHHMTEDIVKGSGVTTARATPAASMLFDVRDDAPKLDATEAEFFKSYVAKLLYLAKRVRPECLTAVAFLTTRTQVCDQDDMAKLRRVLGYLYGEHHRGIVLDVGTEGPNVSTYIDAAYGVHTTSGKSHTGSAIVIGIAGPVHVKSSKQKIVTKSSTEAELVGLSDAAAQAIHARNFIEAQGYKTAPLTIYQDNMSTIALIKRGEPCSDRSRHISIRRFWLKERVDGSEVVIVHKDTADMIANLLTKPVQGRQFLKERHKALPTGTGKPHHTHTVSRNNTNLPVGVC